MANRSQQQKQNLSRRSVASLVLLGGALLWLSSRPAPDETPGPAPVAESAPPAASVDPSAIARVLTHAGGTLSEPERERIARAVVRYSAKYELDTELVTAVMLVEGRGLPSARSAKGAMGLMQVMPAMIGPLGMAGNFTTVESNVEAGCLILADNIRRMGEPDGILAYFWGPHIRGDAYLERVQAARAEVRRILRSS